MDWSIEGYLERIRQFRYNWSDYKPEIVLHSDMGCPRFKVRRHWFQMVLAHGEKGIDYGYLDNSSINLYNNLVRHIKNTNFHYRLTTKEDIAKANLFLDNIIENIERQQTQKSEVAINQYPARERAQKFLTENNQ